MTTGATFLIIGLVVVFFCFNVRKYSFEISFKSRLQVQLVKHRIVLVLVECQYGAILY